MKKKAINKMEILVVVDKTPTFQISVKKTTTIGSIKSLLEKYKDDKIQMFLNNKTELNVFDTNKYDDMNLKSAWDKMKKPSIVVTSKTPPLEEVQIFEEEKVHSEEEIQTLVEEMNPTKEAFNDINDYLLKTKDYIGLKQFGQVFAHAWGWLLYLQEKFGPLICTWMSTEEDRRKGKNYRDSNGIFYLYSKGGFNVQDWAAKQISDCLEKSRFALGMLELRSSFYHANAIIFDKTHKTLTRFEPHGAHTKLRGGSDFSENVDKSIEKWLSNPKKGQKILGKGWTYQPPSSFCPKDGPQTKEAKSSFKTSQSERSGYCEIWSLMFLQYRMMNPDASNSEIIEYMMNPYTDDELRTRIREYGAFISNIVSPNWKEVSKQKQADKKERFRKNKETFKIGTYFETTHKTPHYGVVTGYIESGKNAGKYAKAYLLRLGNREVHYNAMEPLTDQKIIEQIEKSRKR